MGEWKEPLETETEPDRLFVTEMMKCCPEVTHLEQFEL